MPPGNDVVVMPIAGLIVILSNCVWVCTEAPKSVAETVKLVVPTTVGVPEIIPVLLSRVSPAGSDPVDTFH